MIPNEASCPVFSFTFRRKSVVELYMSGREKRKKKVNARVYFFLSRVSSFSLHLIFFVRRSFCRIFRFCIFRIMIFSINLASCKMPTRVILQKKKNACSSARSCVCTADRTRTCALFILFPKVAKKRMCVIFVRVTRCGETGKKWKGKMQNNDNKRYDKKRWKRSEETNDL